jgi:hypothetical protein
MFCYVAYGLHISSALPLPELFPGNGTPDIVIRQCKLEHVLPTHSRREGCIWGTSEAACILVPDVGLFQVRGGCEILVDAVPGVEARVLRLFILGCAIGLLLDQRGLLVLHASAVAIQNEVILFIGDSGAGKSTMAAAMHVRGHCIIGDDTAAVDHQHLNRPLVLPAFPQLKLWPEAASALGLEPNRLPRLRPEFEKRAHDASTVFSREPLALKSIYVLTDNHGATSEIEPLRQQQAFAALMDHLYAIDLLGSEHISSTHFHQCVSLARCVSVYRLQRKRSLELLPAVAQRVEEHVAESQA